MNTIEELKQLIHKTFAIDTKTLKADAPLEEYGLDSLSLAELLFAVEEHFNLDFPDSSTGIKTLAGLSQLIDGLKAAKAS